MTVAKKKWRVGVVGTGHVSHYLVLHLASCHDMQTTRVLTRRKPESCKGFAGQDLITTSLERLLDSSDILVDCTGDAIWATEVIHAAVQRGIPVVTYNTGFHVTAGSSVAETRLVTEGPGDQPGSLAVLHEEALSMGFRPLAYCNMKAFLNTDPTREEMEYWGEKQGFSLPMVTSFTDGTKIQLEQCLVANGLGATIAREGMIGLETVDPEEAKKEFGDKAIELGSPISDFIVGSGVPHSVFLVATHSEAMAEGLSNYKMGEGPYYVLVRDYCLVYLEAPSAIRRMMNGGGVLLDNSLLPGISVAAVAKRDLPAGTHIAKGEGSFDMRGICVRITDRPGHVPIPLMENVHLRQPVEKGEIVMFGSLDISGSKALDAWKKTEKSVLDAA